MSGLLRRLTRRRAATADEPRPETTAVTAPVDASQPATPAGGSADPATAPTVVQPPTEATAEQPAGGAVPGRDLPAGVDPGELSEKPTTSARRGRVRRRLSYLRAARQVLLRDLGGFSYEIHRTAGGKPQDTHRRLLEAKAGRIAALDAEVRELETRLAEPPAGTVLREPGVGGTCPECGELFGSAAQFCTNCGLPLTARARQKRDTELGAPAVAHTEGAADETDERDTEAVRIWAKSTPTHPPAAAKPAPASEEPTAAADVSAETPTAAESEPAESGAAEPEPAAAESEPAETGEDASAETPASAADEGDAAEPATAAEPAATGEADEPATAAEPAATGDPAEPATAAEDAAGSDADDPEAVPPAATDAANSEAAERNGHRAGDPPPDLAPGDPLGSRRDKRS